MAHLHLLSPRGFRAAGVRAGIKSRPNPDVGLLWCDAPKPVAAALFTTNKVFAAPIQVGREHLAQGHVRGVIVNSGNANACTGPAGLRDARRMCSAAAKLLDANDRDLLPSSTGIIGRPLPMPKIEKGIALAVQSLGDSAHHAVQFSDAILTTDTRRKNAAGRFTAGREKITLAGVCKGSGMIGPRLHATMLAYLTTDAALPRATLQKLLSRAADTSFNAVTVDDHASTNDTLLLLASALGPKLDTPKKLSIFTDALDEVCQSLARQIAADGEGATKIIRIEVRGARTDADARTIARAIANSPLVKCAMHGNDPNWGRIVSAAGMTDAAFNPDKCVLRLQGAIVFKSGQPVPFDPRAISTALAHPQVTIDLDCRLKKSTATIWTCDLSKDYVTINADYHT